MLDDCRLRTPAERYRNDPRYHALVQTIEAMLYRADFSPAEVREAAMLASINYELYRMSIEPRIILRPEVEEAMQQISRFVNEEKQDKKKGETQ